MFPVNVTKPNIKAVTILRIINSFYDTVNPAGLKPKAPFVLTT